MRLNEYLKAEQERDEGKEDSGVVSGAGWWDGWSGGATAPLEAVMRPVVDGPLISLLAPPLSPRLWSRSRPTRENQLRPQPGIMAAALPSCSSD